MKPANTFTFKLILIFFIVVYPVFSSGQDPFQYSDRMKTKYIEAVNILGKKIQTDAHKEKTQRRSDIQEAYEEAMALMMTPISLYKNGEYEEAEEVLRGWSKIGVMPLLTLNNLAVVLYAQGKYEEAEKIIRDALRMNETYPVEFNGETSNIRQKGRRNPSVLLNNFSEILDSLGKNPNSDPLYRKAKSDNRGIVYTNESFEMLKIEF